MDHTVLPANNTISAFTRKYSPSGAITTPIPNAPPLSAPSIFPPSALAVWSFDLLPALPQNIFRTAPAGSKQYGLKSTYVSQIYRLNANNALTECERFPMFKKHDVLTYDLFTSTVLQD